MAVRTLSSVDRAGYHPKRRACSSSSGAFGPCYGQDVSGWALCMACRAPARVRLSLSPGREQPICERCYLLLELGLRTVRPDLTLEHPERLELTLAAANPYVQHGLRVLHWYEQHVGQRQSS